MVSLGSCGNSGDCRTARRKGHVRAGSDDDLRDGTLHRLSRGRLLQITMTCCLPTLHCVGTQLPKNRASRMSTSSLSTLNSQSLALQLLQQQETQSALTASSSSADAATTSSTPTTAPASSATPSVTPSSSATQLSASPAALTSQTDPGSVKGHGGHHHHGGGTSGATSSNASTGVSQASTVSRAIAAYSDTEVATS